ncbi:MAG: hypothetical protein RIQ33_48 [Bacteroidota bacterium]|jgi:predicted nucleic acid-binding protein
MHCWWQILVATLAYWMVGSIWFTPKVFGKIWQKSHQLPELNDEAMKEAMKKMPVMMVKSFLSSLLICTSLCYFMCSSNCCVQCTGPAMCMPIMMHNLKIALLLGIATIGGAMSMGYIYQQKPIAAYLVDIGYHVVSLIIASAVLHLLCSHI